MVATPCIVVRAATSAKMGANVAAAPAVWPGRIVVTESVLIFNQAPNIVEPVTALATRTTVVFKEIAKNF